MMPNSATDDAILAALGRGLGFGSLALRDPAGRVREFGGRGAGANATIEVEDWRTLGAVIRHSDVGLGEAYMAGWWNSPDLIEACRLVVTNVDSLGRLAWGSRIFQAMSVLRDRLLRRNSVSGSRRNIAAHYDLGNDFYKLWLDPGLSYSSALFTPDARCLGTAQDAKYARILERLGLDTREVLEIGCGWGGFIAAAGAQDRHVTAVTISPAQYEIARTRAPDTSRVLMQDYRAVQGRYPGIVSIEMFEAVGERYWPTYFGVLRERLAANGTALIQTISIADRLFADYRRSTDFIRRHIFPGGMLPSLPRFTAEAERAGLRVCEVHSFGHDYATTLKAWLERFDAATPQIRALGYDEPFIRGWRFYLALCAAAFMAGRTDVHHIALRHAR